MPPPASPNNLTGDLLGQVGHSATAGFEDNAVPLNKRYGILHEWHADYREVAPRVLEAELYLTNSFSCDLCSAFDPKLRQ
jgi:hypothetical protein